MAKKKQDLSPEERLAAAFVPEEEWPYTLPDGWNWVRIGALNDYKSSSITPSTNPDDTFEQAFQEINDSLAETILEEVMKISPVKFEQMVIDLLSKMGYGAFENAGKVTNVSNDEGIDGIIREDKLGFSLIYVQAKRWEVNKVVGRPEIQAFVGAISGKDGRGLFVTTARFSKQAIDFANQRHIILIDGMRLAKLMIEHNFGVTTKQVFEIKALDTDLFNEYQDE